MWSRSRRTGGGPREALGAARQCAEAARAAVSALERYFGDATAAGSGRNAGSLARSAPPRPAPPPAVARRLKEDAEAAAARVEALVAAAARRAAGEEMGADEDPRFTGLGPGLEAARTTAGGEGEKTDDGNAGKAGKAGKAEAGPGSRSGDADKRRRVGGGGLRLKARVDVDAGAREKG